MKIRPFVNKDLKLKIIRERGPFCEWCKVRTGTDLHHCLIHRMKGKPELDCEENFMLACSHCHTGKRLLDSWEVRVWFWDVQVGRYGADRMREWLEGLPLKIKPKFT